MFADWWQPGIYAPGYSEVEEARWYSFPQSVITLDPAWRYKSQRHTVPRKPGGSSYGHSQEPTTITVVGQVGYHPDLTDLVSKREWERAMLEVFMGLKDRIDSASDEQPLQLYWVYDPDLSEPNYAGMHSVFPEGLSLSMGDGDQVFFKYNAQFRADDVQIYTTAPGAAE